MVERFKGHPCGNGTITDHCNDLATQPFTLGGDRHTERRTDGSAGVADGEHVVLALAAPGEGVQTILLSDGVDLVTAPGQDLVGIGLMAHIPDQPIERGVVDVVQGDGQFDRAETRGKVSAGAAD